MSHDRFWSLFNSALGKARPASTVRLRRGATQGELDAIENSVGRKLPTALRAFLSRHSGTIGIPLAPWSHTGGQIEFLSPEAIIQITANLISIASDFESEGDYGEQIGPIQSRWWSPAWLAIAEDANGNFVYIDFEPDEGGDVGQIAEWSRGGYSKWIADSFDDLLRELCDELESGNLFIS